MKKRLLSAFMALALCLTLLPNAAWAEEAENNIAVQANTANVAEVTIDGTPKQYTDIVAAFDAAQLAASATVKLLKNVTIPQNADSHSYGIRLKSGDITLDLNGCTIQTTGGESGFVPLYAVFYIEDGSSLTVQDSGNDGKIVQPNGGQAIGVSYGNLTVKSGIIEVTSDSAAADNATTTQNCAVFVRGSGVADIQGGTLIGNRGIYVGGEWGGGTLTVSGAPQIQGRNSYALQVKDGTVTLSGGTYTGAEPCSIWNANGTAASLLASGCRFESSGSESEYSDDTHGVVGNTTVAPRPANEYAYIGKAGKLTTRANCTEITAETWDISQGWHVVKENVTISGLNISGEVNLILCDGATLTVSNNMNVTEGSTLNLYWQSAGSGKLTAAAISVPGTVTAPAGEMKKTTGEGGTTFEKCLTHEWGYTVNEDDTHTATCKLCGKAEAAESHKYDSWAPTDANTHTGTCACGATKTEGHTLTCTPNADGLTHKTSCKYCGWTSADEKHTFGENGACVCGIKKSAEYNGTVYASLQAAVNAAAKAADGGTVTLARDVPENVTVTGGTLTVDLNGKTWLADISKNPDIWGGRIPLTVTGGSVTLENGTLYQGYTSSMGSYGIRIQGGSVTVKGNAVVIGSNTTGSADNISYPAIRLESGDLTLETGATLVHGLEVPEGKHLSDYLPEGTAFGLRGYDESTKTWIVDDGLLANAYTTNVYNVPNMALVVVEHSAHDFKPGSDGKYVCACGYTCPHNEFENGVCKICHNGCAHTNVDENGLCRNCKTQMAVKITASDNTVTYGTDFTAAIKAAENGTKITLLADVSIEGRTGISGDNTTVTLDLNGHKITGGWLDVGNRDATTYTTRTLKIIGKGSYEPPEFGGLITVFVKATLDLSGWEGGTISEIGISDNSTYDAETREPAVIVGPKAGTIGKLSFGNNQLGELKKTKLSGGSFNEIWVADFGPVKLGDLLADGYAFQNGDGSYVEYGTTLTDASIYNVKVVKCLHPNMKPDAVTGVATCEYCGTSGKFVASVDGNTYEKWDEAITYWLENGGTLKLYADYTTANDTWKVGSGSHTINLNGHRMSVQGDGAFFKPTNNMHLTVTDGTERGQIDNILLDGSQDGSFTLESGYVHNLKMTDGAVVTLKGGSVDKLDVQKNTAKTNLSIQGGSIGELNIKDWADDMHVSATGGSLGAYNLPSGKILADVLDHQYYAEGTSLDKRVDTAQPTEEFVIKQAPYDFGSASDSKVVKVPINGSIPFRVDSPSGDATGYYDVMWYRRTNSGAVHMTENRVAGVNVHDKLDVLCVITGADSPGGAMQWQVAVKDYTIKVVPADLSQGAVVFTQVANEYGAMGNIGDGKGTFVFTPWGGKTDSPTEWSYLFKVTYNGQPLKLDKDYTIKDSSNRARNAGTYTLTIEGKGNYTGTAAHQWEIKPYTLSKDLAVTSIVRDYDGTTNLSAEELIGLGLFRENLENRNSKNPSLGADLSRFTIRLGAEDFEVSNVKLGSAEAGDTTASFTIKLKPRPGQTAANFVFEDGTSEMTVKEVPVSTRKAFLSSSPKAGKLNVANDHAGVYTLDLSKLLPKLDSPMEYGKVTYALDTVSINGGYYDATKGNAEVKDGKLILPIQAVKTSTESNIGTVKVKVTSGNIVDFPLLINVDATNKIIPTGEPTLSTETLTYGQALSAIKLSGKLHDNVNNKDVEGTFTWADGTVKPSAGSYEAAWKFTPTDGATYAETTGTVSITVNKAKPTGAPTYTRITAANKMLKDAALKPNTSWPTGTIQWVDKDGTELPDTTEVKANTAYKWIFTPTGADADNYTTATGELTLYSVSTGGGSSSGSTVKTDTVTNPDGSVTKTETKKDGTKVETTTGKDGSVSQTTTNPNGSSVTETKAADGSTGTVKTDKNGQTTAETTLSNKAIEDAKRNGEPVKAPVEVKATRNSDTAPTVKIELPRNSGDTKVEIPVTNVKPGTVAVLVHPDGTEEIVKDSIPTENGVQLTVNGDATVKVMDNSKNFTDTAGHWSEKNIDFVSARGLLNGTSANTFSPNAPTTRAQLWTVLARQADADLTGGANWYEKAQAWSTANGISDGSDPNAAISRAQVVTMLWRAMGQPAAGGNASFADVPADSYYAQAVAWAIENGITAGVGGGRFDPAATCTRAQIAAFLARSMK